MDIKRVYKYTNLFCFKKLDLVLKNVVLDDDDEYDFGADDEMENDEMGWDDVEEEDYDEDAEYYDDEDEEDFSDLDDFDFEEGDEDYDEDDEEFS